MFRLLRAVGVVVFAAYHGVIALAYLDADAFQSPQCGSLPKMINASTPNVLVVGDMISGPDVGYLPQLQRLLSPGLATVQHVMAGELTSVSVAATCIDAWINGKVWDVIVIGIGLGDCAVNVATATNTTFGEKLRDVITQAAASSAAVLYVTATPFDTDAATSESMKCVQKHNAVAQTIVEAVPKAHLVDLYKYVEDYCGPAYTHCAIQPHGKLSFNTTDEKPSGLQYTALVVAGAVQQWLPPEKMPCFVYGRHGKAACKWPAPPTPPPMPALPKPSESDLASTKTGVDQCYPKVGLPNPQNASLPNVFIVGDSVMFAHYGPVVKQIFDRCAWDKDFCLNTTLILPEGRFPNDGILASVQQTGQADTSSVGKRCISEWLGGGKLKWDVISINFGIHDMSTHEYVPLKYYRENLKAIYADAQAALAHGGKIVWTTTTPISSNLSSYPGCTTARAVQYNAVALEVFGGKPDVVINDLHAAVNKVCGLNFTSCNLQNYNDVHPTIAGGAFLGIQTARTIAPLLNHKRLERANKYEFDSKFVV